MKKFVITLCLTVCFCFLALTSFAQEANAAHAYINLETFECPNSGNYNYKLEWKSEEEVPSIPEANEYSRLWPTDQEGGVFCKDGTVIEINEKTQFPVDLNELVRLSINTGKVLDENVVPATQDFSDSLQFSYGGAEGILTYFVTFE